VPSTGIFTNPYAIGKYLLTCQVTYTDAKNDGYRILQVLVNSSVIHETIVQANSTLGIPRTITVTGALKLTTNDTVKIQFGNTGTGLATVMAATAANRTAPTHWDMTLQATS
jgi:hypothetical protein